MGDSANEMCGKGTCTHLYQIIQSFINIIWLFNYFIMIFKISDQTNVNCKGKNGFWWKKWLENVNILHISILCLQYFTKEHLGNVSESWYFKRQLTRRCNVWYFFPCRRKPDNLLFFPTLSVSHIHTIHIHLC